MTTNIKKIYHLSSKKSKKDCSDLLMNLFIKKLSGTKITKEKMVLMMVVTNF